MYLSRHTKKSGGVIYETWTLVETVQTIRGPRQRIVATLGKLPGLDVEEKVGWEEVARIRQGKPKSTPRLTLARQPIILIFHPGICDRSTHYCATAAS